ncbi:nucleotidyltransferase domain-containing protein [Natronosporangium hydrolyticum]|uniref:Nucleotidyltransferase domain-containing protein n=1 Tax=Natronosporangium hydrolyticum TaxID=2811111 RepID=A0A895YB96_9ACTN|nr:nucleotidyltransferase domain-containing protein [Natronosporangium hydrolyticum]QSB14691.1 nucleotidyltransferase domain-containing protein [Natronosporangium hydrolyticum]
MTLDPQEGIDAAGYLTTGAALDRVRPPFAAVLSDAVDTLTTELGSWLHGLYLYGSVATGQARPAVSDLDLLVVVTESAALARCRELAALLSQRHREIVSAVGVSAGLLSEVTAPGPAGRADRCFLKHYCVPVSGVDLRPEFPRCRPDRELAREFIGDLDRIVGRLRAQLQAATSESEVAAATAAAARRLWQVAAVLYSAAEGGWSTDRGTGAAFFAERYPEAAAAVSSLLPDHPAATSSAVAISMVDRVAEQLQQDLQRLMDAGPAAPRRPGRGGNRAR